METPTEPGRSPTSAEAAQNALEILRSLVNPDNAQALGFDNPGDVAESQLGVPLPVYVIPLDQLKAYSPDEGDPESLLVDLNRVMYPVLVNGEVRSSVAVELAEGGWVGTDFGGTSLITSLDRVRRSDDDFVVQVPALNLYFIASRDSDGLQLTPIVEDARFDFTVGEPQSASEILRMVLPAAQAQEDVPG